MLILKICHKHDDYVRAQYYGGKVSLANIVEVPKYSRSPGGQPSAIALGHVPGSWKAFFSSSARRTVWAISPWN